MENVTQIHQEKKQETLQDMANDLLQAANNLMQINVQGASVLRLAAAITIASHVAEELGRRAKDETAKRAE